MAKRQDRPAETQPKPRTAKSSTESVEDRVVALAEQLGRLAGTVQTRAEGWLDRAALNEQLMRVRDGAAELLSQLATATAASTAPNAPAAPRAGARSANPAAPTGRSGGKVDAPGKKHRKPPASARGVQHSDETISKVKGAQTLRRGQRRG